MQLNVYAFGKALEKKTMSVSSLECSSKMAEAREWDLLMFLNRNEKARGIIIICQQVDPEFQQSMQLPLERL